MTDITPEQKKTSTPTSASGPPTLKMDWERFGAHLEASDLSEDEKREVIETLWSIVVSFVDLGFGLHPTQQSCGETINLNTLLGSEVITSLSSPKTTFNAVSTKTALSAKGDPS